MTLAELIRFFNHPARALMYDRAGLWPARTLDPPQEQIPVKLTGLDLWPIGERLLRQRLQGQAMEPLAAAEWRRGLLPPRALGQQVLDRVAGDVEALISVAEPFRSAPATAYEVLIELPGSRLTGVVNGVVAEAILRVSFSRLAAKHRLQAWLELLALTLAQPGRPWQAVTIGRGQCSVLGPVDPVWAARILPDLVELRRTGLRGPIPFSPRVSGEYAALRNRGRPLEPSLRQLRRLWEDDRDEAYERFFGVGASLETLMAEPS